MASGGAAGGCGVPIVRVVRAFGGRELVLINRDATDYDALATLTIREPIGQALGWLA